jgi:hypothetical protein
MLSIRTTTQSTPTAIWATLAGTVCLLQVGTPRHSAGQTASAARAITPSAIAGHGLPIRSDTMDGLVEDRGRRNSFGYYVYAVARTAVGGKAGYLITMNYVGSGSERRFQSDTLAVDSATLSPQWHRFHARGDSAVLAFRGRYATGWASREHQARVTVDHQLSDGAFDAGVVRWIVPTLPLAIGYQATISSFNMWSNAEETATLTVTGAEVVQVGDRRIDTWVVRSESGARRWIAKASGVVVQTHSPSEAGGFWTVSR